MKKSEISVIQSSLKEKDKYTEAIDGIMGEKTDDAIQAYLQETSFKIVDREWMNWNSNRKGIAALQMLCLENNIEVGKIDGLYGPQTASSSDLLIQLKTRGEVGRSFVDISPIRTNPHNFPFESTQSLTEHYGKPCEVPLVKIRCPWTLKLDWDLSATTNIISIHEKLGDSLSRILGIIYNHYGEEGIKKHGLDRYGGSYNCRFKRGSSTTLSTHAWGIALDWYPSKNQLKWRSDRATLANPELDFWWQTWENEGWLSLGRAEDRDWMHVQAAKR